MDLLIKNARIIDSSQDFKGDVYIKDGIIDKIGKDININCEVVDAKGLILMPSFIDLHVHFREPGYEYKEDIRTGSLSALRGGYTTVNLMGNTNPICSTKETVDYVLKTSEEVGLIDIHQTVSMTRDFDGEDISHLDNIPDYVKFISDDGKGVKNNKVMLDIMIKSKEKDLVNISHAEDEDITPFCTRLSENIITSRDIELAKYTGARLHMAHVSTIEAMKYIIEAKRSGANVTCEVAPHHIALTNEVEYRVNPPLREKEDVEFLIDCIKNNWVDMIATDHAPHSEEDKKNGAPGMVGLETAFSVCLTKLVKEGHIGLNKLSELMSKNPAKLMKVNKGEIKIGLDGDLVLVDIDKKIKVNPEEFASKGRNTVFKDMEFFGSVEKTIVKGKVLYSR
ncbi:dihydroorotase PyrC [Gottschalkia acidurici 9a]|uniref:Dihydroorotase PyrC n=1 Tax=Gottschalkia acidurici (strain ATCC 7906 / DSM 604 / BCRC 14475 / CIP 104303 / KCTC 5404 / NCIMB 10678 / 9a) TaxID=1128398 RepID=K0AYD0_GOTA9|nr:dihydroorotase [Gottschalkia acidurici]AFS77777.1 dihydroorotase PyrC [Gottschalkia acidurici 9a]